MIFNRVVAAGEVPCCSRAMAWPNTSRRAWRYEDWNSGSFSHRKRVLTPMPAARAASSAERALSSRWFAARGLFQRCHPRFDFLNLDRFGRVN